jgi:hypothetical protein
MKYTEALDRLDAIGECFASQDYVPVLPNGYRLQVMPRGQSHQSEVQLQFRQMTLGPPGEKFYWRVEGRVYAGLRGISGMTLVTYIECSINNAWLTCKDQVVGLRRLFDVAQAFDEFTAGRIFEL